MNFGKTKILGGLLLAFISIIVFSRFVYSYAQEQPSQSVSVSVDPHPSDFQSSITSSTRRTVPQDTIIQYTITYGSNLYYSTPLTIQAEWSQGTAQGSSTPDIDVADYVLGSASEAYGDTPAAVDLINQQINWTIDSFPSRTTNKTVSFELKTNDNFTGSEKVSFTVYGRTINDSLIVQDETANSYRFNLNIETPTPSPTLTPTPTPTSDVVTSAPTLTLTPTPTPGSTLTGSATSTPTPTPALTSTPTPSPTPTLIPLTFDNIQIESLSSDSVLLDVELNQESNLVIRYGKSPGNLLSGMNFLTSSKSQEVKIEKLDPDTTFYVQIHATTLDGKTATSDILTLKTPPVSEVPLADTSSLIITSDNVILASPNLTTQIANKLYPVVVIPKSSIYQFQFKVNKYDSIKKVQAVLRNKFVLGINFLEQADASTDMTSLEQIAPGVFEGQFKTPADAGDYEIVARIFDYNGNIAEQKLAELRVVKKLTVLKEGDDHITIESARVLISRYDPTSKIFQVISSNTTSIKNPSFTDLNGEDNITLPSGRYKASVQAIGYASKEVEFMLGGNAGQDYPPVYLKSKPFDVVSFANYYYTTFLDFTDLTKQYLLALGNSNRFFEINAVTALLLALIFTVVALSTHTRIPVGKMHSFLFKTFRYLFSKNSIKKYILGQVMDEQTGLPISGCTVYLIDSDQSRIAEHSKTNKKGEFYFNRKNIANFKLLIFKKGYEEHQFFEFSKNEPGGDDRLSLKIKKFPEKRTIKNLFIMIFDSLLGILVPLLIIFCLITELIFGYTFGWVKTLPFLIVSSGNALIWIKFYRFSFKYF